MTASVFRPQTEHYERRPVTAHTRLLVVYAHPTRNYVSIEPVSHVNNAINLMRTSSVSAEDMGVRVLQPGESMSAEMSITVERTA